MIPVNIIVIFNNIGGRDRISILVRGRSAIFVLIVTAVLMILTSARALSGERELPLTASDRHSARVLAKAEVTAIGGEGKGENFVVKRRQNCVFYKK